MALFWLKIKSALFSVKTTWLFRKIPLLTIAKKWQVERIIFGPIGNILQSR